MDNIILIGFMGAGKTTVGRMLAKEHHMAFLDTDDRIVDEQGRSIPEIFDNEGEPFFRDLETDLLRRMLTDTHQTVISVGGGMPVREENRSLLKRLGCVVYLVTSKQTILGRVKGDGSRPLLKGEDLEAKVDRLMRERESLYKQAAHLEIQTDGRSVRKVAQIIWQQAHRFL
jgi:shikimate kinase